MFSEMSDGLDSDLRIRFGRVAAYTVYEEFVHPWDSPGTESPMIGEGSRRCVFPLLLIQGSEWLRSLSDRLLGFPDCVHYRLLTLDEIVDVLCNQVPEVSDQGVESITSRLVNFFHDSIDKADDELLFFAGSRLI